MPSKKSAQKVTVEETKVYEVACNCYDIRLSADRCSVAEVKEAFKRLCKKWVFQTEKGDTGYLHYQGRISLIKKRRKPEIMKLWNSMELKMPFPEYFEPTVSEEYRTGSMFYVMKEDTRVDGVFTDELEKKLEEEYVPKQYRGYTDDKLRPFQYDIKYKFREFDDRRINLIYHPEGNGGKSTIASVMELEGKAIDMPPINDSKELVQVLCDICVDGKLRDPSPIFIDMPRAMEKNKLSGMYTAIEQIKKGKLYDLRYHYKKWWIDSPIIWVFTNTLPNLEHLTNDRWRLFTINDEYELIPFKMPNPGDMFNDCESSPHYNETNDNIFIDKYN